MLLSNGLEFCFSTCLCCLCHSPVSVSPSCFRSVLVDPWKKWDLVIWPITNEHNFSSGIARHGDNRLVFLSRVKCDSYIFYSARKYRTDGQTEINYVMIYIMIQIDPGYCTFLSRSHKFQRRTERMGRTDGQKSELGKGPQNKISLKNQNNQ